MIVPLLILAWLALGVVAATAVLRLRLAGRQRAALALMLIPPGLLIAGALASGGQAGLNLMLALLFGAIWTAVVAVAARRR